MKVLYQEWKDGHKNLSASVSKDYEQYKNTLEHEKQFGNKPLGELIEAELPDELPLAEKVKRKTIFLDQEDIDSLTFLSFHGKGN